MSPVHDRMPVVLERDDWEAWLSVGDNGTSIDEVRSLMVPADSSILVFRDVSTDVNNVRNKDSSLIDAV